MFTFWLETVERHVEQDENTGVSCVNIWTLTSYVMTLLTLTWMIAAACHVSKLRTSCCFDTSIVFFVFFFLYCYKSSAILFFFYEVPITGSSCLGLIPLLPESPYCFRYIKDTIHIVWAWMHFVEFPLHPLPNYWMLLCNWLCGCSGTVDSTQRNQPTIL